MKINFNHTQYNFGSKPIYPIKLRKLIDGKYRLVDGYFSELSAKDAQDVDVMSRIYNEWTCENGGANYAQVISRDFKAQPDNKKFYATELKEGKDLYSKLGSILELTDPKYPHKAAFDIFNIQSSPEIINNRKAAPIRGAGTMGIYGSVKLAQDNGFQRVDIFSSNNPFYDNLEIPQTDYLSPQYGFYALEKNEYNKFLRRISKRYHLNTDSISNPNNSIKLIKRKTLADVLPILIGKK